MTEKGSVGNQAAAFLRSSLDIAVNGLKRLNENTPCWSEAIDEYASIQDKLVVESLLLVLILMRFKERSSGVQERLQEICEFCAPQVYTPRNRMLLGRYPHTAVTFGISHLALSRMGYGDPAFGRTLEAIFRSQQAYGIERLPYRAMEVRWLHASLLGDQSAQFDDLLPVSMLQVQAHPLRMSISDSYALTHALMYVTDFGDHPPPVGLNISRLESIIDQLLAVQIVNENLDVLGELLMSLMFLGRPWSIRARFAWHFLSETWGQYGFLPSPSFETPEYAKLNAKDAQAYAFKHTYHTLYVGAILCSLVLRRPQALTITPADHPESEYMPLSRVIQRMDACPSLRGLSSCQWTKVISGSSIERAALSNLLFDGLAAHAAQQYDLLTLCGLIEGLSPRERSASDMPCEIETFLFTQWDSAGLPPEIADRIAPTVIGQHASAQAIAVD